MDRDTADIVIKFLAFITLVALPALGVTLIVTSRFALRPIVEAMLRLREGMDTREAAAEPERLRAVEDELRDVRSELRQLRQVTEFMSQLRPGEAPSAAAAPADPHAAPAPALRLPTGLRIEPRTPPEPETFDKYAQEYL